VECVGVKALCVDSSLDVVVVDGYDTGLCQSG